MKDLSNRAFFRTNHRQVRGEMETCDRTHHTQFSWKEKKTTGMKMMDHGDGAVSCDNKHKPNHHQLSNWNYNFINAYTTFPRDSSVLCTCTIVLFFLNTKYTDSFRSLRLFEKCDLGSPNRNLIGTRTQIRSRKKKIRRELLYVAFTQYQKHSNRSPLPLSVTPASSSSSLSPPTPPPLLRKSTQSDLIFDAICYFIVVYVIQISQWTFSSNLFCCVRCSFGCAIRTLSTKPHPNIPTGVHTIHASICGWWVCTVAWHSTVYTIDAHCQNILCIICYTHSPENFLFLQFNVWYRYAEQAGSFSLSHLKFWIASIINSSREKVYSIKIYTW